MCSHFAVADRLTEPEQAAISSLSRSQEARRQRVIEAAIELATEGGYDAVQMREVAAAAGVALGTIYRYFSSKDHLLAEAQVEWLLDLDRRVSRRPPRGDTTADRVIDVLRWENEMMRSGPVEKSVAPPDQA